MMKGMRKLCCKMRRSRYKARAGHVAYNVFKKQQSVINDMSAK